MSDWSDIGGTLKTTREEQGWSLQDVAHRTRIPIQKLAKLEENDYSDFPSPAYAKSFLAQYSEHLGIDANDWLDEFDTGDVYANLDSCDYLKEHDEHLDAQPLTLPTSNRRVKAKKEKAPKEKRQRDPRARTAALQPLMVFVVSAGLITGAVFGVLNLSDKLSEPSAETAGGDAGESERPVLQPVSNFPDSHPLSSEIPNAPRAVISSEDTTPGPIAGTELAGSPGGTGGTETLSAPSTQDDAPAPIIIPADTPRAVIIEE